MLERKRQRVFYRDNCFEILIHLSRIFKRTNDFFLQKIGRKIYVCLICSKCFILNKWKRKLRTDCDDMTEINHDSRVIRAINDVQCKIL